MIRTVSAHVHEEYLEKYEGYEKDVLLKMGIELLSGLTVDQLKKVLNVKEEPFDIRVRAMRGVGRAFTATLNIPHP